MRRAAVVLPVLLVAALLCFRYLERAGPAGAAPVVAEPAEAPVAPEPEPRGPVLRGTVLLPDGAPAPFAILHANTDAAHLFAFADERGAFELRLPRAVGRADLVAEHVPSGTPRSVLRVARAHLDGATLEVRLTSATISGRAIDGSGRPVPFAGVEILGETPPSFWRGKEAAEIVGDPLLRCDRQGRFSARIQSRPVFVRLLSPGLASRFRLVDGGEGSLGDVLLEPLPRAPSPPATAALR